MFGPALFSMDCCGYLNSRGGTVDFCAISRRKFQVIAAMRFHFMAYGIAYVPDFVRGVVSLYAPTHNSTGC